MNYEVDTEGYMVSKQINIIKKNQVLLPRTRWKTAYSILGIIKFSTHYTLKGANVPIFQLNRESLGAVLKKGYLRNWFPGIYFIVLNPLSIQKLPWP